MRMPNPGYWRPARETPHALAGPDHRPLRPGCRIRGCRQLAAGTRRLRWPVRGADAAGRAAHGAIRVAAAEVRAHLVCRPGPRHAARRCAAAAPGQVRQRGHPGLGRQFRDAPGRRRAAGVPPPPRSCCCGRASATPAAWTGAWPWERWATACRRRRWPASPNRRRSVRCPGPWSSRSRPAPATGSCGVRPATTPPTATRCRTCRSGTRPGGWCRRAGRWWRSTHDLARPRQAPVASPHAGTDNSAFSPTPVR
jgi:hypothetical protein